MFAADKDAAWNRVKFFDEMTTSMPIPVIKQFARNAAIQDDITSYDFYKSYIQRPEIAAVMGTYIQDKQEKEEEVERLQKIERELFGDIIEEKVIVESIPKQIPLRTKTTYEMSEVKAPKRKFSPWKNTACVRLYKDIPWLDKKIEAIYISADTETPDSWEDNDISPYVHEEDIMEYNGEAWYQVNNKYYDLQCNIYSHKRLQKGDVLTVYTNSNEPLKIRIAYQTDDDIIIQDTDLFRKELDHLKQRGKNRDEKIRDILKEPMNEQAKQLGIKFLASVLNKVAPNINDYHAEGEYVQKAIESIESNTIGDFAKQLGDLIAYLDIDLRARIYSGTKIIMRDDFDWDLLKTVATPHPIPQYKYEDKKANIFIDRIKGEYYLPDILVNLSPVEKLPEIFDDPNSTDQKRAVEYIEKLVQRFMFMFGNDLYILRFPSERYHLSHTKPEQLKIKMDPWKTACVNAKDVEDIPDMDVVYYNDGENIYCLIIKELIERFREGDHINPVTNDPLSEAFIARFNELYNPKIIIEEKLPEEPKEQPKVSTILLAPGLLKKVKISIDLLKAQQEVGSDFESNAPYSDSESVASYSDFESVASSTRRSIYDKTTEEYDGATPYDFESDASRKNTESIVSGTGSLITSTVEEIVDAGVVEKCTHCDKKLGKNSLTSMKYKNQKPIQVSFCDFDCFENHDDWPKFRRK